MLMMPNMMLLGLSRAPATLLLVSRAGMNFFMSSVEH